MSDVYDDLPWIAGELELIRQAVATDLPVIGHCLGGQLLAKALGAAVSRNPVKEIGWTCLRAESNPQARDWLGEASSMKGLAGKARSCERWILRDNLAHDMGRRGKR